jgi:hypothetical protein
MCDHLKKPSVKRSKYKNSSSYTELVKPGNIVTSHDG